MNILLYIGLGILTIIVLNKAITWYQRKYSSNYKNIQLSGKVVDKNTKEPVNKAAIILRYTIHKGAGKQTPVEERLYTDFNGNYECDIEQIAIQSEGINITIVAKEYQEHVYTIKSRFLNDNIEVEKKRILLERKE
jgi:hypothetical protein